MFDQFLRFLQLDARLDESFRLMVQLLVHKVRDQIILLDFRQGAPIITMLDRPNMAADVPQVLAENHHSRINVNIRQPLWCLFDLLSSI